jgi:serine protease Do
MNQDMNKNNEPIFDVELDTIEEPMSNNKKKKKVKARKLSKAMSYLLAGALILGSAFGAGYGTANLVLNVGQEQIALAENNGNEASVKPVMLTSTADSDYNTPATAIAQAAGPSIVTVISVIDQVAPGFFSNQIFESEGTGSGVIYKVTNDGVLIITNNHVIENAKSVSVILNTGVTLDGEVVGFDTRNDLALVKVSNDELEKNNVDELTPATFGDSKNIQAGELAVAIGNPMGKEFSQTVTVGVISAVDRELDINGIKLHVIQTDAAINPGNSGGGLFNKNGEIIGINTAKLVDNSVEGMGFAIPIHIALPIIEKIENIGNGENVAYIMEDNRAYLGILMGSADSNNMSFGVYVQDIVKDGPADQSDLKVGDQIVAIDGKKMADSAMLYDELTALAPGDKITLEIIRDEQFLNVEVTLGRYGDFKEE